MSTSVQIESGAPKKTSPHTLKHVAIIMDGNGRWAKKQGLKRIFGHRKGVESVRMCVASAIELNIPYLTLFAFSSENWQRPSSEVSLLLKLLVEAIQAESEALHQAGVCVKIAGDTTRFSDSIQATLGQITRLTQHNSKLLLTICLNYGGRWDIVQAVQKIITEGSSSSEVTELDISKKLMLAGLPAPDLLIRTGAEKRLSNFLLWQLAYSEIYFSDTLWPQFSKDEFLQAVNWFEERDRRFGRIATE